VRQARARELLDHPELSSGDLSGQPQVSAVFGYGSLAFATQDVAEKLLHAASTGFPGALRNIGMTRVKR
jgi:hypothetical protein